MKPSEVLEQAAAIVDERWQQLSYGTPGGPRCILGALEESAGLKWSSEAAAAQGFLRQVARTRRLARWNDRPGRRQKTVARKLREAAAKAREAGQ